MTGFTAPNYTQTPNDLFDTHMREMGEAELRVTLAVIRKTMGFHKDRDAISYSQIMEMTGLSRTSTQAGIQAAIEHGFIEIVGHGKRGVNVFGLVVNIDQSTSTTSTSSVTLPVTSSVTLLTKETDKEKKKTAPRVRKSDPIYDAIAKVWKLTASGQIVSMKAMMLGTSKRGTWQDCNFNPPVTDAQEILDFEQYMIRRMRELNITQKPTAAVTIQRWFYDFRLLRARRAAVSVKPSDPTMDLSIPQVVVPKLLEREEAS